MNKAESAGRSFGHALASVGKERYLGDYTVVDGLLRSYVDSVMSWDDEATVGEQLDKGARSLAKVFLGQDKRFVGTSWNSPGQIDSYVAQWAGVDSADPEERVAGAAVEMVNELVALELKVQKGLFTDVWKPIATAILAHYVRMFLGLPLEAGYNQPKTDKGLGGGPAGALPTEKGNVTKVTSNVTGFVHPRQGVRDSVKNTRKQSTAQSTVSGPQRQKVLRASHTGGDNKSDGPKGALPKD